MKKFISMVMAAAMVVSLVPATAFAYEATSTAKVLDVAEMTEAQAKEAKKEAAAPDYGTGIAGQAGVDKPELHIKVTDLDYTAKEQADITAGTTMPEFEFDLKLDNAEWLTYNKVSDTASVSFVVDPDLAGPNVPLTSSQVTLTDVDKDEATVTVKYALQEDDVLIVKLDQVRLTKSSAGAEAKVTIKSDDLGVKAEDLVFAVVQDNVLAIEADDTTDIAEEEIEQLEEITIEATTGFLPKDASATKLALKLKLNKGFEFDTAGTVTATGVAAGTITMSIDADDEDVAWISIPSTTNVDKIKVNGIKINSDSAKVGDVATITVSATDWEKAVCDVATVVGDGLVIEVDEDADVPEMWSGVEADTNRLTDDDDNVALAFTIKETVKGAHDIKDVVELVLPEGVWVVESDDAAAVTVDVNEGEAAMNETFWNKAFAKAYQKGDHQSFEFAKRTLVDTANTEAFEIEVELQLVADPGFVGDVVVEMLVDGESAGEVTIATFKTPLVVEAQSNDLKIDYRNTEIASDIVVKEAEAGLWATNLAVGFEIDKFDEDAFEDDMVYTVNEDESGMEIDGDDDKLFFVVEEESDDEAAVITISNLSLFMSRNIPAGSYDLTMYGDVFTEYNKQVLFAADCNTAADGTISANLTESDVTLNTTTEKLEKSGCTNKDHEDIVDDVCDYSDVVKEGFVNIVTAGREQDDASFTTKVVVPVGESYIVAGETTITLDVPAYVSEAGYTMLPVRAVATALGINNNNVLWDAATKTVTILYGQRIITMQVGSKVINVNGSAIPASASVEIVNGRTFLPMRDLATALGVTDITWDAATKTATLNGSL